MASEADGGGIENNDGIVTITNSTIFGNAASGPDARGGAIISDGTLTITNSTVAENLASSNAGGLVNYGTLNYANTIIANSIGGDCSNFGSISINTNNLVEDSSCSASLSGDPSLGLLTDNGGSTQTMALLTGSLAIGAGDDANCPDTDQRGIARPQGSQCDIGAYEFEAYGTFTMITADGPDPSFVGDPVTVSVAVSGEPNMPTGTVDVSSSESNCSITLLAGSGSCELVLNSPGFQIITANYSGDALHGSSFDTENHIVINETVAPTVLSIVRADANPTSAITVDFTVTFSESVTGVDISDFVLATTGVTGASIISVSGSDAIYTVTVNTGSGNCTIRLDVTDTATITDLTGNPLVDLPFIGGEPYAVNKTMTFRSSAAQDGWILESSEASSMGGTLNKTAATLRVGDDAANKQYRSVLSFDIPTLPEGAIITSITLQFKYAGKTGTLPFGTHGNLLADIWKGSFRNYTALQLGDCSARSTETTYKAKVLSYTNSPVDNWYSQSLNSDDYSYLNFGGVTQFRLRFTKDDNNDFGADYLKLYSGNALEADRPQLIIEYYIPS